MPHSMLGNYSSVNFQMLNKLHYSLGKVANKLDIDKVFWLDWKGTTFNVAPFLCAGLSYYTYKDEQASMVRGAIGNFIRLQGDCLQTDLYAGLYEFFCANAPKREFETFHVLPLHPDTHRTSLSVMAFYLYVKDPKAFLKVMLEVSSALLSELVLKERNFEYWDEMTYTELGNKEAFSFYIGLQWLIDTVPQYKMLLGNFLKKLNLKEKYEIFCPEGCFIDKILRQEIETEDIREYYYAKRFLDGSNEELRDRIQAASNGTYNGHDINKDIRDYYWYFDSDVEHRYMLGESDLANARNRYYAEVNAKRIAELEQEVSVKDKELTKNTKSIAKQNILISKCQSELDALKEENSDLKLRLNDCSTDTELKQRLLMLEDEIRVLKEENSLYEHTHLRDKQEISFLRKKVGKIEAQKIVECLDFLEEETTIEDCTSIEDKVNFLQDKKIVLVGAEFLSTTLQKINEYGLTNVTLISKDTKKPGRFDVGVVLTTRCLHDVVRHMETFAEKYNAVWLHSPSVNAEKIIDLIYEYCKEE